MVSRLVKQQHIGRFQQQFGKLNAHAPTTRKLACGTVEIGSLKAKTEERFLHILFKMGHVDGIKLLRERRHLFYELHIFVALIVGSCGQLVVYAVNLGLYLVQMSKRLTRLVKNRATVFCHEVLRQISDDTIFRRRHRAARGFSHACNNFQECALAGSVLAHKGYTILLVYLEGNVFKKGGTAKLNGQSINCYHICFLGLFLTLFLVLVKCNS